jgi:hypothetical protein
MHDLNSRRPRRNRQEWQSLVKALAVSALDLETFCEQQAISPVRLKYWRRQMKKAQFIELPDMAHQAAAEQSWDVELTLGQDVTLRLRSY